MGEREGEVRFGWLRIEGERREGGKEERGEKTLKMEAEMDVVIEYTFHSLRRSSDQW